MQITAFSTASKLNWSGWLLGIWTSAISAAAGAVSAGLGPMITDPKDFNLGDGLHHTLVSVGIGALITGVVSICKFLQMHPAPDQLQAALEAAATSAQQTKDAVETAKASIPESK